MSLSLAIVLIATMVPWPAYDQANADALYFQFNEYSTDQAAPTPVNAPSVNLSGSFTGVAGSSLTYKIEQIVSNGVTQSTNGSTTPLITGNNFLFMNIELYEGLNRLTVMGVNNAGNIVQGSAYVIFNNVPVITEIRLSNGTVLADGVPQIVGTASPGIIIRANNAAQVTVNGALAFPGGSGTFIVSDLTLQPGMNNLAIVASNSTKTYAQERQVVYQNGQPTAYNITAVAGTTTVKLEGTGGNSTFAPLSGSTTISGKILFDKPTATDTIPAITVTLKNGSTTIGTATNTPTVGQVTAKGDWMEMPFSITGNNLLSSDGNYTLEITTAASYGGDMANFTRAFTIRSATSPYITGLKRLYNVSVPATNRVTYTSSATFASNQSLFELPLFVQIDSANLTLTSSNTKLEAFVNGTEVGSPAFTATPLLSSDGTMRVYRIDNMPAGEVQLKFSVLSGSPAVESDSKTVTVQYIPVPSISVTNMYDGFQFSSAAQFTRIEGKLTNFNLTTGSTDLSSLKVTMNGVTQVVPAGAINSSGVFVLDKAATPTATLPANMTLVPGPNEIMLSGTANGVPVSTKITVYLFATDQPAVKSVRPVPYVLNPYSDDPVTPQRKLVDTDLKFRETGTRAYTTTETKVDILFNVENIDNLIIQKDGEDLALASSASTGNWPLTIGGTNVDVLYNETPASDLGNRKYQVRIFGIELPKSGPMTITIKALNQTVTVTESITITRELAPFEILSPKLPNERVVNQNFLNVSIKAEGADRIEIGKEEMVKGLNDIFRLEVELKRIGNNTIKFTVYRGTEELDGEFTVNYAGDNSIGAQYKALVTSTGKVSAFKGELQLSFPKNTFLRPVNLNPGQVVDTIDLFDSQKILFGIADKRDGRTVKAYNRVNELDGVTPQDGTIRNVLPVDAAIALIQPKSHFGFASNLYWVDAGYSTGNLQSGYTFVAGEHPYKNGNEFYGRASNRWLEPSQRGTITIKYDSALRNVAANSLSVWRYHNNTWTNLGGKVDTGKQTVTAEFDGFGYYAVQTIRYSYNDIVGHEYARNSLELMYARGIMQEKNSNEFGVYDNITRGEFAQLMVKMLDIPLDYDPNSLTFDDVIAISIPGALWDYRYIETAARKGIIRGKGPRLFLPNEPLTREEAAVIIARATNLLKGKEDADRDRTALQKQFTDGNLVDYYAVSAVLAVNKAGYITGLPNTATGSAKPTFRFDPFSNMKRADAAIIAERVMKKAKML